MSVWVRRLIVAVALILLISGVSSFYFFIYRQASVGYEPEPLEIADSTQKHRMIVFVHGTMGATFGLLDIPSVMKDNLKGSIYTKTARSIRKDPFFYTSQPILERGLVKIEPSFDSRDSIGFYGAYPICRAYQVFATHEASAGEDEVQHYYLFGWSGLLSQSKRRAEAVRFYNALNEEVRRFKEMGVEPEITIVTHSHGGNLSLNLGIADMVLEHAAQADELRDIIPQDILEKWRSYLGSLPSRSEVRASVGQKVRDYRPESRGFSIDKLIMLGVPIQPETDFGVFSALFNKIYHIYSSGDKVQPTDWISTRRFYSDQRFDRLRGLLAEHNATLPDRLVQIRVMFDRPYEKEGLLLEQSLTDPKSEETSLWWKYLVGTCEPTNRSTDPTHKELWFAVFDQADQAQHFLRPVPVASLSPLLVKVAEQNESLHDFGVNISLRDTVCFDLVSHGSNKVEKTLCLDPQLLENVRDSVCQWQVDKTVKSRERAHLARHMRWGRGYADAQ